MARKGISPSALDKLRTCAQSFDFRYNQQLISGPVNQAAKFGTLHHKIMELFRKLQVQDNYELTGDVIGMIVEDACEAVQWEDPTDPKEYRTREKALLGLHHYIEKWGDNDYEPILINGKPATETELVIEVGLQEPLHVVRDLLAMWNANENTGKELWGVDYKTTSRLEGNWVQTYSVSDQFKHYTYASREGGVPEIVGTVCDVFRVTKGNKSAKTAAERDGCVFYRLPIRHSDFVLKRWYYGVKTTLFLKELYEREGVWPTNAPKACVATWCEYLNLCNAADEDEYEAMLKTYQRDEEGTAEKIEEEPW